MSNDINGLDPNDEGLKAIMGGRFHDVTEVSKKPEAKKVTDYTCTAGMQSKETTEKVMEAKWCPVKEDNWTDNLKDCAKSTCLYAGLSFLIFYWANAGLMASSIAIPCNWLFLFLAGVSVGKCFTRGRR